MTTTRKQNLPIGIQTFARLREEGCYYVDKTGQMLDLIASGSTYFLSRPRRFGKSLLVDTLKELFEGNRALFTGLEADTRWDWTVRHPVIRLSFGGGVLRDRVELDQRIAELLDVYTGPLGLKVQHQSMGGRLETLIRHL
ncbi:AAA family ATPase, partial [Sphaerotilus sp.]|uniref:AAA family ATPase n=1 Tax=Sphaerotilus sp. TaxID=2093942 RepID=UPI0025DF890D